LQCLVEAFDLAVLPWAVWPDRDVAGTDGADTLDIFTPETAMVHLGSNDDLDELTRRAAPPGFR